VAGENDEKPVRIEKNRRLRLWVCRARHKTLFSATGRFIIFMQLTISKKTLQVKNS
jgi:hypothetical protein